MQQIPFIDLFKSALHFLGDELAHPQKHILTVYAAFGTMHCNDKLYEFVASCWLLTSLF